MCVCAEHEDRGLMGGGVYKHEQVIVIIMKLKLETPLEPSCYFLWKIQKSVYIVFMENNILVNK